MTDTPFTPGKWKVETDEWEDYLGGAHTERTIVTAYNHPQLKRPAPVVALWNGLPEKEHGPPRTYIGIEPDDARLIAKAPELLQALEMLQNATGEDEFLFAMKNANKVLAEAKGETVE